MARNNFWQVVGEIDSDSQPGVLHMIKRHTNTGSLSCDCMAYRFARGEKTCKHVMAYRAVGMGEEVREAIRESSQPVIIPSGVQIQVFTTDSMTRPGVRRLRLRD